MSQEEKQLLLKDLCVRLPYGVIVHNEEGYEGHLNCINQTIFGIELDVNITSTRRVDFQLDTCKPYLRLMSSMTEDERNEWADLFNLELDKLNEIEDEDKAEELAPYYFGKCHQVSIDWLNTHHFDYRGLIEKSLAIVAPEEMYK